MEDAAQPEIAFSEIGQSGRKWTRDDMIASLEGAPEIAVSVSQLTGRVVGRGMVLVEYETSSSDYLVRRTSLWRRAGGTWQIVFHQGTRVAED